MANHYEVGGLELGITTTGIATAASDIAKISRSLNSLYNSVKRISELNISSFGTKFADVLKQIANSTLKMNVGKLDRLASVAKSLSSISKIGSLEKVDWGKIGKGFSNLTTAITPFVNKIKDAEKSLTALYGILNKAGGKKIQGFLGGGGSGNGKGNSFGKLLNIGKITAAYYTMRRVGHVMGDIVQHGVDYTETLNLWQTSMKENLGLAEDFVSKMQKAYGVSSQTLMQTQATLKNMIGSLGEISDAVAYSLSESITQMALDYASLYNVTFETATNKFQSALAGQVRPVRQQGYDITESTLYTLYQSLGGTKTVRQLNRTEKQLLSILAIFKQMENVGATGDLTKTLDQFANQSRMMTENWKEFVTWIGISLQYLLQEWGVMKYINAALITMTEMAKAYAYALGYVDPEFGLEWQENVEGASDAMDELKGKLLGFDKFRSLSGEEESPLAIDDKLLEALSGYNSYIDQANNKAQQLAETWLKNLGFVDENGDGVLDITYRVNELKSALTAVAETIGAIIAIKIVSKIWASVSAIEGATFATKMFQIATTAALYGGILLMLYAINDLTKNWNDMSSSMRIAKIAVLAVGVALVTYAILSKIAAASTTSLTTAFILQRIAAVGLAVGGIGLLVANIALLAGSWDKMEGWQKVIGIFGAVGAAALAAAAAIAAFQGSWSLGTATVAIVGALAAIAAAFVSFRANTQELSVPMYATGASNIDGGTLFVAGEMGRTEAVYTGSNGKTNVANVQQMEQAFYNAMSRYYSENGDDREIVVLLDGEKVYQNTTARAKSRGNVWAKA